MAISNIQKANIAKYWGFSVYTIPIPGEIHFPITQNHLIRLFNKSSIDKVAVMVENISDKNNVNATWIAYENQVDTSNVKYVLFPQDWLVGYVQNDNLIIDGFPVITARLAEDALGEYIYFHRTKALAFNKSGGGGVPTGSSGTPL